jgi:F0F1-type ATP synthase assembly protein I
MRFSSIESQLDRIAITQLTVTIIVATLSLSIGWVAAYSSLLGGLVTVIPGIVFIRIVLEKTIFKPIFLMDTFAGGRFSREAILKKAGLENVPGADGTLTRVARGELIKFLLSVVLFVGIFVAVNPLNALFFFGTFVAMQSLYAIVPFIEVKAEVKAEAKRSGDGNNRPVSGN